MLRDGHLPRGEALQKRRLTATILPDQPVSVDKDKTQQGTPFHTYQPHESIGRGGLWAERGKCRVMNGSKSLGDGKKESGQYLTNQSTHVEQQPNKKKPTKRPQDTAVAAAWPTRTSTAVTKTPGTITQVIHTAAPGASAC